MPNVSKPIENKVGLIWEPGNLKLPPYISQIINPTQFTGSELDNLVETACRICYDSFNTGRSSEGLHYNVQQQNHNSVYQHPVITVRIPRKYASGAEFYGRPGLVVELDGVDYIVTANLCAVREFDLWTHRNWSVCKTDETDRIGTALRTAACIKAPLSMSGYTPDYKSEFEIINPPNPRHAFVSIYVETNRTASHEIVRHRHLAVSQRSGRYCDDRDIGFLWHPADDVVELQKVAEFSAKQVYINVLTRMMEENLPRKQAMSAARHYLPHSLRTRLILTGSLEWWVDFIDKRANRHADAVIRDVAVKIYHILRETQFANWVPNKKLNLCEDGFGFVLE